MKKTIFVLLILIFNSLTLYPASVASYSFTEFPILKQAQAAITGADVSNLNMNKSMRYTDSANSSLEVLGYGFVQLADNSPTAAVQNNTETAAVEAKILDTPLFYPSPFRLTNTARLNYTLSKDMDMDLRIYDMRGYEIFKTVFFAGENGARAGYNTVILSAGTLNNFELSAGVYFFVLINNGKVLGKGKFGVIP